MIFHRSRACFFLLISVFVCPGVHGCCVYSVLTHKSTILYIAFVVDSVWLFCLQSVWL